MKRSSVPLEELYRLLPDLEELEVLRLSIVGASVPDPGKEWASSSAYTTIDKRIVSYDGLESTLQDAEEALHEHVSRFFSAYRKLFRSFWAGDDGDVAHGLLRLGEQEHARGRNLRARQLFEAALNLSLPLTDKGPQILALRRIAKTLIDLGELHEALRYYNRSAEIASNVGDLRAEVAARTGSGNVLLFQGRWTESEEQYLSVLSRIDAGDDDSLRLERGQLYNNLGTATARQNRPEEAERWFAQALELWSTLDAPLDLAICYHSQALLWQGRGQRSEARENFERALALAIPAVPRAVVATDLAVCFAEDGALSQAEVCGREAESIAIAARSPYALSHMYRGLGNIARVQEDEGGVTFFEKALEIATAAELPFAESEILVDYALLRSKIGEKEEALSYLQRAKEIFTVLGAVHELARAEQLSEEIRNMDSPPVVATHQ